VKLRRIFIISVIILSLIVSGAALGGCNKEQPNTPAATTKDESKKVAEQIAVVNEDTGVEFPSGTVNYSDEFIKTLDEEIFTITSATDAEEGLKDGTYAGSLMFPANLSYMILNINYGNPQRIILNYLISDIADKDISDKTHKRIIESYQEFNDRLSYAYINALLEEVEQGQNDVGKIFGNDASILAAAEKFSDGDYDSEYKNPDLPNNTLDYSEHNTDDYRDKGIDYANDVGDLYRDAYNQAHEEETKIEDIPSKKDVVDVAKVEMQGKFGSVKRCRDKLDEFINTKLPLYEKTVDDYVKVTSDYVTAASEYQDSVDGYVDECITTVENMSGLDPDLKEELLNQIRKGKNISLEGDVPDENTIEKADFDSTNNKLPSEDEFKSATDNLDDSLTALYDAIDTLTENLKPENMLKKAMTTGDTNQTYKQKIDEKKSNFSSTASETTKRFNEIQKDNIEKLTNSYEKNNKYMTETVEALNKKSEKDQETLKKAIGDFLKTAKGNSADTKKRLESFRSMLEKAKVEGRISSAVVEFLIQPIQLEEYIFNY